MAQWICHKRRDYGNVLLVCRSYLAVAMWDSSVYHLFVIHRRTVSMWQILLYHSRWLVQCKTGSLRPLLNLVPGRWKWWKVCRDDDGGCQGSCCCSGVLRCGYWASMWVGPCEWHNFLFQQRGQKDLFVQYYQRALLDAYLLPFLSNLWWSQYSCLLCLEIWVLEMCSTLTENG